MTTINEIDVKCSVCNNMTTQRIIMSSNQFGHNDLDTRPSEMFRSTIGMWINECPHCGYVASRVDKELIIDDDFLKTDKYRTCDGIEFKSNIANLFYKQYLIERKKGNDVDAFFAILHCAWACDDAWDDENSKLARKTAVKLTDNIIESYEIDSIDLKVMKADLLRRSGEFDQVIEEYNDLSLDDSQLNRIIRFQVEKAHQKDSKCYSLDDV